MKFCSQCGETLTLGVPDGDNRKRHICTACSAIHYENPRIITGCIPAYADSVLLCRRAIQPRKGFWTLPAVFLEHGETISQGAERESIEEAHANLTIHGLYGIYDIVYIGQVHMFYRATLNDLDFHAGQESLETELFREEDIPWRQLAFPVINIVLEQFFNDRRKGQFSLKTTEINRTDWQRVDH